MFLDGKPSNPSSLDFLHGEGIMEKTTILLASKRDKDRSEILELLAGQSNFLVSNVVEDDFGLVWSAMKLQPNVIIMDFCLEKDETIQLVPTIKRNSPVSSLIMLCSSDKPVPVERILRAGVSGYLIKNHDSPNIVNSIQCVLLGGLYISKTVKSEVANFFILHRIVAPKDATASVNDIIPQPVLTKTELQIFLGILLGNSDKEIAKDINMSTGAIRNCVCQVKKRLDLKNRTQVSMYALSKGLIEWKDSFVRASKDAKAIQLKK